MILEGLKDKETFYLFELGGVGLILGVEWLTLFWESPLIGEI